MSHRLEKISPVEKTNITVKFHEIAVAIARASFIRARARLAGSPSGEVQMREAAAECSRPPHRLARVLAAAALQRAAGLAESDWPTLIHQSIPGLPDQELSSYLARERSGLPEPGSDEAAAQLAMAKQIITSNDRLESNRGDPNSVLEMFRNGSWTPDVSALTSMPDAITSDGSEGDQLAKVYEFQHPTTRPLEETG